MKKSDRVNEALVSPKARGWFERIISVFGRKDSVHINNKWYKVHRKSCGERYVLIGYRVWKFEQFTDRVYRYDLCGEKIYARRS